MEKAGRQVASVGQTAERWHVSPCPLALCALLLLSAGALRAQVVINEVLAANRGTNLDEEGDSSDWLEILNASDQAVELAGYGLTDDARNPRKWIFPSLVLDAGERLLVWCSGKDRTSPPSDLITMRDSPVPFEPSLVSLDAEWRYLVGAPEDGSPPEGWNQPGFDDASWPAGPPGFGFNEDGVETVLPENIGAVFLRHWFVVDSVEELHNLVLQVRFDDGFVAYLNGERVVSANSPEEEPTFDSVATRSNTSTRVHRFDLSGEREHLNRGENLISMVLLNYRVTSDDLALMPELGTVPPALHTNFELGRGGEAIYLSDAMGRPYERVELPPQSEDHSYGRFPDGTGSFFYMLLPTPGAPNDGRVSGESISDRPEFVPESGEYSEAVDVEIRADFPFAGFEIRYTWNGEPPSPTSSLYEGPIQVTRDTVLRAAGFLEGKQVTRDVAKSYFLAARTRTLELPILSVSMRPADFQFVHLQSQGRGPSYEKPAHMEIFTVDGTPVVATGFGLRLHGGAGRNGEMNVKKAYKAYFRGEYGVTKLRFPIIPDTDVEEFDKLVLRANFNDAFRTGGGAAYIRDQLIRDLHEDMGGFVSHGSWYNLLVNMQYRGIYNVVERLDKEMLSSYFPEDGENWDVIRTGNDLVDGNAVEWTNLRNFMQRNDLRDDALYEQALEMIDVENFTSYMILNIWAQNHDWPHNNWYVARPRRPDGKWMFLSWDAEFGIGRNPSGHTADTFAHAFSRPDAPLVVILNGLLRSRRYQTYFLEELDRHLEGALSPENVLEQIGRLRDIVAADMRWEVTLTGASLSTWQSNVRSMETFARLRGPVIRNHILNSNRFTFPRVISVSPRTIRPEDEVDVSVRGRRFTANTMIFFANVPSPKVEIEDSTQLLVTVPFDIRLEGTPGITAVDPNTGSSTSHNLLRVRFLRPQVTGMDPASGSAEGGELVKIFGADFTEGVRVEFGGVPSLHVERVEEGAFIVALTPPGTGTVPVGVINTRPGDLPAEDALEFTYVAPATFRRGDANGDGQRNVTDAVTLLRDLFGGARVALCADALDVDDSGAVNLTDGIVLLNYLFRPSAAPPAAPLETCGADPTQDELGCAGPTACD